MRITRIVEDGDTLAIHYFDNGNVMVADEKSAAMLIPEGEGYRLECRWWKETPVVEGREFYEYQDASTERVTIQGGEADEDNDETPNFANLCFQLGHMGDLPPVKPWMVQFIKDNAKSPKPVEIATEDIYALVIYDDGSKLWMGHSRPAFPNLLIRPDGKCYRVQADSDSPPLMMTEEDHNRIKAAHPSGWGYMGEKTGPIAGVDVTLITGVAAPDSKEWDWKSVKAREMTEDEFNEHQDLGEAGRIPL